MVGLGFIVSCYFYTVFLLGYGLDMQLFIELVFANPVSTFFAVDLIFATIVFYIYLYQEAHRSGIKHWWIYVVFSLFIGLSFAFPLFLYYRERKLETEQRHQ
jgi:hypothetical protein